MRFEFDRHSENRTVREGKTRAVAEIAHLFGDTNGQLRLPVFTKNQI